MGGKCVVKEREEKFGISQQKIQFFIQFDMILKKIEIKSNVKLNWQLKET